MNYLRLLARLVGHGYCRLWNIWWQYRDKTFPVQEDSILFVAHPDDDTLFFHSFIREHKPFVVLLFTGWSLRRLHDFSKVMRLYGVRWRAYDTVSARAYSDPCRRALTESHVRTCLALGHFTLCATHNAVGEYGHKTHRLVHEVVISCVGDLCPVLCPVLPEQIGAYPLPPDLLAEKEHIFCKMYTTELFVRDQYRVWFFHEKLAISNPKIPVTQQQGE